MNLSTLKTNKLYLEVPHTNEDFAFKIDEATLNNTDKSLTEWLSLSKHVMFTKYFSAFINYFFENEFVHCRQTGYTATVHPPIIFQWKMLHHISSVDDATAAKCLDVISLIGKKGWKLITVVDKPITRNNGGEFIYTDAGPAIEFGFSAGEAEPRLIMLVYASQVIFIDKDGTEQTLQKTETLISATSGTDNILDKDLITTVHKNYSTVPLPVFDDAGLLKYFNITDTKELFSGDASMSPIDVDKLNIKSNTVKSNLKKLFSNNKLNFLYHNQYLQSVKNTKYFTAIHSACIEVTSIVDNSLIDRVYILNNYVLFESAFNTSKYGNLLQDETVNGKAVYVGKTEYDPYRDFFYYTIYDKDLSNLNIQKYGSVQFKLSVMMANMT